MWLNHRRNQPLKIHKYSIDLSLNPFNKRSITALIKVTNWLIVQLNLEVSKWARYGSNQIRERPGMADLINSYEILL